MILGGTYDNIKKNRLYVPPFKRINEREGRQAMIGYGLDLLRNPDKFYDSLGFNKKETPQKTSDSAASQPYQIGYGITDGGYTGTNISFGNDMGMSKNANSAQTKNTNQEQTDELHFLIKGFQNSPYLIP